MSLVIGKIVKAQGIKGEVKVVPITDDALRFNNLKKAFVGEIEYPVEYARVLGEAVFLKFAGADTRNDAELLIGQFVSVSREDAVKLPDNSWFIVDILGCKVYVGERYIGTLVDILQNQKVDVYVVGDGKKQVMFPALKDLLTKVDTVKKVILLDEKRFEEVAVYNDEI